MPPLIDGDQTIWESLAIIETIAESFPGMAIWPNDRNARAHARAISNEMHGGFQTIRQMCPMNLGARYKAPEMTDQLQANLDRLAAIWSEARQKFGKNGPYLYGGFSAADAMYAPVVTRFDSGSIAVDPETRRYMDTILRHPDVAAWRNAALKEPWTIADYDVGHTLIETFR